MIAVSLNGQRLGQIADSEETAEFEITRHLVLHNELIVDVNFGGADPGSRPGGLWGTVALEIRFDGSRHSTRSLSGPLSG